MLTAEIENETQPNPKPAETWANRWKAFMKAGQLCIVVVFLAAPLGACASRPEVPQGMASSALLQPNAEHPRAMHYIKPGEDFRRYDRILLDRVQIYDGPDAHFHGTTPADRQEIARFMQSEFARVLGERRPLATSAGPGVARLKLTLVGLEQTRPALSTATHLVPVGAVMNLGRNIAGAQGSFMGSVTYMGEVYDAQTGELLATFLNKRSAEALDITSAVTGLGAARSGVTDGAYRLREAIEKIRADQVR